MRMKHKHFNVLLPSQASESCAPCIARSSSQHSDLRALGLIELTSLSLLLRIMLY